MSDAPAVPDALRAQIAADPWGRSLGIEILDLRPGYCRLTLTLRPHMVNFQGYPHGGVIFSLADTAFGAACNSHGRPAVALSVTIGFLAAIAPESRLFAEAQQRKQGRQAGFYEVTVTSEDGTLVALLHCVAHRLPSGPSSS